MTRIFVFYHIIQNSLELKNELQWKKYHVYGGYTLYFNFKGRFPGKNEFFRLIEYSVYFNH